MKFINLECHNISYTMKNIKGIISDQSEMKRNEIFDEIFDAIIFAFKIEHF